MEAKALRVEAITSRLEAIAIRLEAIAIRFIWLEAIALRVDVIPSRLEAASRYPPLRWISLWIPAMSASRSPQPLALEPKGHT